MIDPALGRRLRDPGVSLRDLLPELTRDARVAGLVTAVVSSFLLASDEGRARDLPGLDETLARARAWFLGRSDDDLRHLARRLVSGVPAASVEATDERVLAALVMATKAAVLFAPRDLPHPAPPYESVTLEGWQQLLAYFVELCEDCVERTTVRAELLAVLRA